MLKRHALLTEERQRRPSALKQEIKAEQVAVSSSSEPDVEYAHGLESEALLVSGLGSFALS